MTTTDTTIAAAIESIVEQNIAAAAEHLNATETPTGYRWHDDASNSLVEASAADLEQLGAALLNDGDVDQAMAAMCIETVPA